MSLSRRIAVFSDVHANRLAMQAFLHDLEKLSPPVDGCWCLGDIVGRGPEPLPVASRLKELYDQQKPEDQANWLAGNHDLLVRGDIPRENIFDSPISGQAKDTVHMAEDNARKLKAHQQGRDLLKWLQRKPCSLPYAGIYLAHGGYSHNGIDFDKNSLHGYYVNSTRQATRQLKDLQKYSKIKPRLVLNGHTHIPMLARLYSNKAQTKEVILEYQGQTLTDLETEPICVNPGSVGFPRQEETKMPTYAILNMHFDSDWLLEAVSVEFRKIPYDWRPYFAEGSNGTQGLMARYDYPEAYRKEVQQHALPTT